MDKYLLYKIENFLDNISIDIATLNDQLSKFENKQSICDSIEDLIYFSRTEFMHDCNMLEVFCRALRDKLENG
jgi:hypothetical protein